MQKDLDRLWQRKRRTQRILIVVVLSCMAALVVVGMRTCGDHYKEPYNKEYRPMDSSSKDIAGPES